MNCRSYERVLKSGTEEKMTIQGEAHPYVPQDLKLPGFVPIFLSQSHIVGVYGGSSFLVVLFMWILSGNYSMIIASSSLCFFLYDLIL